MAAPAYAAAGAGDAVDGGASSTVNPAYPSGIVAGDLLLLQVAMTEQGEPWNVNVPSGWTELHADENGGAAGNDIRQEIFAKSASGSESGTLAVTMVAGGADGPFMARMYRVTGWLNDATMANNFEGAAVTSGTSTTISAPSVTTVGAERLCVAFVAVSDDNALDAFTGETGGDWTEAVAEFTTLAATDGALGLQIATLATATTISGGTDTMAASDGWVCRAFAIKPAAAAGLAAEPSYTFQAVKRASYW